MTGKKKKVVNLSSNQQVQTPTASTTRVSRSNAGTPTGTPTAGSKGKSSNDGPVRPICERSLRGYPTTTTTATTTKPPQEKLDKIETTTPTTKKDDVKVKARKVEEDFLMKRTSRSAAAAAAGKGLSSPSPPRKILNKDWTPSKADKEKVEQRQKQQQHQETLANVDDAKKPTETEPEPKQPPLKSPTNTNVKRPSKADKNKVDEQKQQQEEALVNVDDGKKPSETEFTPLKSPKVKKPSESETGPKEDTTLKSPKAKRPSETESAEHTPLKSPKTKKPSISEPVKLHSNVKKSSESEHKSLKSLKEAKKSSESETEYEDTPVKLPSKAKKPSETESEHELAPLKSPKKVKKPSESESGPLKSPKKVKKPSESESEPKKSPLKSHSNAEKPSESDAEQTPLKSPSNAEKPSETEPKDSLLKSPNVEKPSAAVSEPEHSPTVKLPESSSQIISAADDGVLKVEEEAKEKEVVETLSTVVCPNIKIGEHFNLSSDVTATVVASNDIKSQTTTPTKLITIEKTTPTEITTEKTTKSPTKIKTTEKATKTPTKITTTEQTTTEKTTTEPTTTEKTIITTTELITSKTTPPDITTTEKTTTIDTETEKSTIFATTTATTTATETTTTVTTPNPTIIPPAIVATIITTPPVSTNTTKTTIIKQQQLPLKIRAEKRKKSVNNFLKISSSSSPASASTSSTSIKSNPESPSPLLKKVLAKSATTTAATTTSPVIPQLQTPNKKSLKSCESGDKYYIDFDTTSTPSPTSSDGSASGPKIIKKGDTVIESYVDETSGKILAFEAGIRLEVQDADPLMKDVWYPSKVVLVNNITREILVHYDNWNNRHDSWISMDSPRIRPTASTNIVKLQYKVDERIEAFWVNGVRYPGVIKSVLPKDKYEILFDDGIKCVKKHNQLFKIKSSESQQQHEEIPPPRLESMTLNKSGGPKSELRALPALKPLSKSTIGDLNLKQNFLAISGSFETLPKKDDLNASTPTTGPGPSESLNVIIGEESSPNSQGSTDLGKRKRNIHNYSLLLKTRHKKSFDDEDYTSGSSTFESPSAGPSPSSGPGLGSTGKKRKRSRKPRQNVYLDQSDPGLMNIDNIPPPLLTQQPPKQQQQQGGGLESINFVSPTALKRKKVSLKGNVVKRVGKGWRKGWKLDRKIGRLLPATPSAKSSSIQQQEEVVQEVVPNEEFQSLNQEDTSSLEPGEIGVDKNTEDFDEFDEEMDLEEISDDSDEIDEEDDSELGPCTKRKKKKMREPIIPENPNILNIPPAPSQGYRCEKLKLKIEDVNEINLQQIINDPEGIIFELNDPKPEGWRKEAQIKYVGEKFPKWFISYISPAGDRFRYKKQMQECIQEYNFDFTPFDFRPLNPRLGEIANLVSGGMYSYKRRANMPPPVSFMTQGLVGNSSPKASENILKAPAGLLVTAGQTPSSSSSNKLKTSVKVSSLASPAAGGLAGPALPIVETGPKESGFVDEQGAPLIIQQSSDGWICPVEKCSKVHRKEHLLQMHFKHYHPELKMKMKNKFAVNVVQMAQARTVFEYNDEQHQHQTPVYSSGPVCDLIEPGTTTTDTTTTTTATTTSGVMLRRTRSSRSSTETVIPTLPSLKLIGKKSQDSASGVGPAAAGGNQTIIEDKIIVELSHYDDPPEAHAVATTTDTTTVATTTETTTTNDKSSSRSRTRSSSSSSRRKENPGVKARTDVEPATDLDTFLNENNIDPIISISRLDEGEINLLKNRRLRERKRSSPGLKRLAELEDNDEDIMEIEIKSKSLEKNLIRKRAGGGNKLPTSSLDNSFELDADSILNGLSSSHVKKLQSKLFSRDTSRKLKTIPHDVKVLVINCICNVKYEFGLMIQCELCQTWQHGNCFGIEDGADLPKYYICDSCKIPEGLKKSQKFDFSQEFFRNGRLPCLSFGPKPDPIVERELKDLFGLLGKLSNMKEDVRSAKMRLKLAQEEDHPKIYQWDKKQPNPIEQAKKEIYEKTYGPIIKKLLQKHKDDPQYVEKLKSGTLHLRNPSKNDKLEETTTTQEIDDKSTGVNEPLDKPAVVEVEGRDLVDTEDTTRIAMEIGEPQKGGEISQNNDLTSIYDSTSISANTIRILNSSTTTTTTTTDTTTATTTENRAVIEPSTSAGSTGTLLTNLSEVEKEIVDTLNQNPEEFLKTIEDMTANAAAAAAAAESSGGVSGELNSELNLNIFNDDQLFSTGAGESEEPSFEYPTGPELPQRITKETCKENLIDSLFKEQQIVTQELAEIQKRFREITKEEADGNSGEKSAEEMKMDKYRLFILLENLNLLKNITASQ